jgi:hypothetical protein
VLVERKERMASSSRQRQTMAKLKRERAVKEKRALKLEKKAARKQAAAEGLDGLSPDVEAPADPEGGPLPSD